MKKATFTSRLLSYILDMIIILLISTLVSSSISTKKLEKLETKLQDTVISYTEGNITIEEYMTATNDLTYQIQKNSLPSNTVYVVISIGYFIIFAYLNKGQTLGKKILKLKVTDNKEASPTLMQMIIRTLIINQILPNTLLIILILLLSKNNFINVYTAITIITYIFIVVSAIMILYRNDKLGLHDIISKTKVVKEGN
jgi:uncharacterized RDD family membrane protein YckC